MKIADEQIDRLLLLTQQQIKQQEDLKTGAANNNPETGIFITQPWEAAWQGGN